MLESVLNHVVHSTRTLKRRITQLEREKVRLIDERKSAMEKYEQCVNIKEEVCESYIGDTKKALSQLCRLR